MKKLYMLLLSLGVLSIGGIGCSPVAFRANMVEAEQQRDPTPRLRAIDTKPGVQLWGENCIRCHNAPPPAAFGDAEWEIITHHMRVRANLTEEEVQKIRAFLISSN